LNEIEKEMRIFLICKTAYPIPHPTAYALHKNVSSYLFYFSKKKIKPVDIIDLPFPKRLGALFTVLFNVI